MKTAELQRTERATIIAQCKLPKGTTKNKSTHLLGEQGQN